MEAKFRQKARRRDYWLDRVVVVESGLSLLTWNLRDFKAMGKNLY
jgi:hypothetical protein